MCTFAGALPAHRAEAKKVDEAEAGVNYPPIHPNCRCTTVEYDPEEALDWLNSGEPMPKRTTYQEWYNRQTTANGQGSVEVERKKAYNRKTDLKQFEAYAERLGADAPSDVDAFQVVKYAGGDTWTDLKGLYSYKGRVPEATKADFSVYRAVKATGIYGTVRVPPEKMDTSVLTMDVAHVLKKHDATLDEAKSFIEDALFSLKRQHQSGATFINYYSGSGAAYVRQDQNLVKTAFKCDQYKADIKNAVKVVENARK